MKANIYRLKQGTTKEDIITLGVSEGGGWINRDSVLYLHKNCFMKLRRNPGFEFTIYVTFPEDLSKWDDFEHTFVMDDDFAQPYTPFYGDNYKKDITDFPCLEYCIQKYNEFLDSIPVLERV